MKKILIADDDPAICDSLQMMLEDEGYDVETTINGETVTRMTSHFPDLLLLDIWMSGQDGREIAKQLKNKQQTKHIPIIMISASRELEEAAKESGVDDFLEKPFQMNTLLAKVKKYIYRE